MGKTLFKAPSHDPSKSQMENVLELTPVTVAGPDVFTNTRPLWHPPGARGIYGGAVIAQSLSAAQHTVPDSFYPHSMHCYFVLAGDSELPVLYHVERVRDGRSFATRTVQARQQGKAIFTATMSFDKATEHIDKKEKRKLEHESRKPDVEFPNEEVEGTALAERLGRAPLQVVRDVHTTGEHSGDPAGRSFYHFLRTRPRISAKDGAAAHFSAFAYMSDASFIGTVLQAHGLPRFASMAVLKAKLAELNPGDIDHQALEAYIRELEDAEARANRPSKSVGAEGDERAKALDKSEWELGMIVSMDHTIYFHTRHGFRADQWMLVEMYSPWAGEERGLVIQKAWARDGTLIATCVQEGIVRMKQAPSVSDGEKAKL